MHNNNRLIAAINFWGTKIFPPFVWIFLLYGFDEIYIAHLTLISAILHEMGHCLAIILQNGDFSHPGAHISGFRIKEKKHNGYRERILITLAGPLVNFAICFLLYSIPQKSEYLIAFASINLATGLSNILPIQGFDGYEIIKLIFDSKNFTEGIIFLEKYSFAFIIFMTFFALYLIGRSDGGYWFFFLSFSLLLSKTKKTLKSHFFENN